MTPESSATDGLSIRFAGPRDAATIHAFIVALAEYERAPNEVQCGPQDLARELESSVPAFECLLAEHGNRAVGFALFFHHFSTWRGCRGLYLEDLFVLPAERGRGIGRRLLSELARLARARGCARMEWAVLDWNQPAIDFYRRLGAEPLDAWTTYRLSDEPLAALAAHGDEEGSTERAAP